MSETVFQQGSLQVIKSKSPDEGLKPLLLNTTWGSKGFRYTQIHAQQRIGHLNHPYHFSLKWGKKLLGNITLDHRIANLGKQELNAYYIRYFVFNQRMQASERVSNSKKQSQNKLNNHLLDTLQTHPYSPFVNYSENPALPAVTYGFVDATNARSLSQGGLFEFERIRQFKPLVFYRTKPQKFEGVRSIYPNEKPLVKSLIKDQYKNHSLVHFTNLFKENKYYVLEDKGVIYAGCQVTQNHWKVAGIGSPLKNKLVEMALQFPRLKQIFDPKEFKFISLDHIFVKPGYEEALFPFFESLLHQFDTHFGMIALDTEDPLYEVLNNHNRLGIASRIMTFKPGYVIAKGLDNYSLKPFYEKPVFISGFDVT